MKKYSLSMIVVAFLTVAFSTAISAQSFGSSELIRASEILENAPLSKDAKGIRALAVTYVIETKDVTVVLCGGELMAPILDKKNKNSTELIGQYTIAMAAFKLQNPDNKDENAAQYAGLASTVRAYKAIVSEKPRNKHSGMDKLVERLDRGELQAAVQEANCGGK